MVPRAIAFPGGDRASPRMRRRLVLAGLVQVLREVVRRRQGFRLSSPSSAGRFCARAQPTVVLLGILRVLLAGTMRLPTWFTAGVMLQETAGFTPAKIKDGQLGSSPPVPSCPRRPPCRLVLHKLRPGADALLSCEVVHGRVRGWGCPVIAARAVATAWRSALMYVVVAGPVLSVCPA